MKLKDIVPYCLSSNVMKPYVTENKYYWIINGLTYTIDSLQSYNPDSVYGHIFNCKLHLDSVNFINLNRHYFKDKRDNQYDHLTLNLDNEITIFDQFILVHKTGNEVTDCERNIFVKTNYYITNNYSASSEYYTIGFYHFDPLLGGMATNLRTVFKDLIIPPVQSKPAELTLDEKVDDLIDELMKDSRTTAIKKLKRMLNERL